MQLSLKYKMNSIIYRETNKIIQDATSRKCVGISDNFKEKKLSRFAEIFEDHNNANKIQKMSSKTTVLFYHHETRNDITARIGKHVSRLARESGNMLRYHHENPEKKKSL